MQISTFKKILPALRLVDVAHGKKLVERTIDVNGGGDYLVINAQDYITDLEVKVLGVESSHYASCVNFSKFNTLLGSLKETPSFDYEAQEGSGMKIRPSGLVLKSGKRTIKLDSAKLDRMDYGTREFETLEDGLQFDVSRLAEGFKYVSPAISSDETRFHLNGILLAPNGDFVATDGHRLHVYQYANDGGETPQFFALCGTTLNKKNETVAFDTILPRQHVKMLQAAIKACGGSKAMVYACHGTVDRRRHMQFIVDGGGLSFKLTCKLIDSKFVTYDAVIPKTHESRAVIDTATFVEASKLLAKMSEEHCRVVEFRLNGQLHLKGGGVTESMDAPYTGEGFEFGSIGANGNYLVDAANLPGESCTIEFGKALEPIKVTQKGGFLAVVMPTRV